jgi:hypothetical protein
MPVRRGVGAAVIVAALVMGCAKVPVPQQAESGDVTVGISLSHPMPWSVISSPLQIAGRADRGWFFEGSCGVRLVASDGTVVAERYVKAEGDPYVGKTWLPFSGTIEFEMPEAGYGSLVLTRSSVDTGYTLREFQMPIRFRMYE